jgi:hypothetical protein
MAEFQTVATDLNMVRGSGKVEVAPYTAGDPEWVDAGAIVGLTATEQTTVAVEENDNADSNRRISKQEVLVAFTQLELLNLDVWEIMRGNLDTIQMESQTTKILSGDKTTLNDFMVRITTKNDDKTFTLIIYKANINKGWELAYQKDDGEDTRLQNTVELLGRTDANRGDLVYEIESYFNG